MGSYHLTRLSQLLQCGDYYGFAVLHKLDSDFLNPEVSCATSLTPDLFNWLGVADAEIEIMRMADEPARIKPIPTWQQKLMLFRPIDQQSARRCLRIWDEAH